MLCKAPVKILRKHIGLDISKFTIGLYQEINTETTTGRVLKITQNSKENTFARVSFLIKLQPQTFLKEHLRANASVNS